MQYSEIIRLKDGSDLEIRIDLYRGFGTNRPIVSLRRRKKYARKFQRINLEDEYAYRGASGEDQDRMIVAKALAYVTRERFQEFLDNFHKSLRLQLSDSDLVEFVSQGDA